MKKASAPPASAESKERRKRYPSKAPPPVRASKRTKPTSASSADAESEKRRSRLLELPTELLDMIYGHVAADAGAFLCRKSTSLYSTSGLMCVSREVRDGFQSILNISALEVRTKVMNFDFSHIVRFLNQLSERELNALPTVALPTERKFIIKLKPTLTANPETLQTWLLRLEHPSKRGTQIQAEYTKAERVCKACHQPGSQFCRCGINWVWPVFHTLNRWLVKLEDGKHTLMYRREA